MFCNIGYIHGSKVYFISITRVIFKKKFMKQVESNMKNNIISDVRNFTIGEKVRYLFYY